VVSDEEAVRAANQGFYRAFESLELVRMDAVWAHDGLVACVHPGWPLSSGWEAVRRSWRTIFENTEAIRFEVTDEEIEVSGDLAWVLCVEWLASEVEGARGEAAVLATNVFRRVAGAWKLVHHHASPRVPDPATEDAAQTANASTSGPRRGPVN
jgi:ketosteroid isomerase-like protein